MLSSVENGVFRPRTLPSGRREDGEAAIIPECFGVAADELADLSLLTAGTSRSADVVGQDQEDAAPDSEGLDVPPGTRELLAVFQAEATGPVTSAEAHDLATEHDGPDVGRRTIRKYLSALEDAGALDRRETPAANTPDEYRVR